MSSSVPPPRSLLTGWLATRWKWIAAGAALLAVVGAVAGCSPASHRSAAAADASSAVPRSVPTRPKTAPVPTPSTGTTRTPPPTTNAARPALAQAGTALALLTAVAVKGRAPLAGYSRAQFGPAWADVNHNGCDTRDDVLAAQLTHVRTDGGCRVVSGSEADPYTNASLYYVRGRSTVDIDHVVALGDAWQTGAQQLSVATRTALANDPLNLLAVSLSANRAKGDADAASWLPKQKSYRCAYVARQVAVKARYHLWTTRAEHAAIAAVLARCPAQPAPTAGAPRNLAPQTPPPPTPPTPTRTARPMPTTTPARTAAPTHTRAPTTTSPPAPVVVHPGAFCAPEGARGVTDRGTAMVCGPSSGGRNRWRHS